MKRFVLLLLAAGALAGCGGPSHMVKQDAKLDVRQVKPQAGKSALVVARATSFGGGVEFESFLDKQMIGVTKGVSCFVKNDIQPGKHYVSSRAENFDTVLLNFDPDKTYYITHDVRMGIWKARVSTSVVTADQAAAATDGGCNLYVYDAKNPGDDLSDSDWKDAQTEARNP